MARLNENGFDVTQATISRDIKELRLYKRVDRTGKTRYGGRQRVGRRCAAAQAIPRPDEGKRAHDRLRRQHRCHQVALAGMAQAVCAAIDAMDMKSVVGTVAGEDTIFLLVRQESQVEKLIGELSKMLQP